MSCVPGQRLPSERELVGQFEVSRSTVREALRVLESNGVVRSRPGDPNGPEVLPFSSGALRKQMVRLARVDEVGLAELVSFRMILDGSATMLAARLRTPEQLAEMEAAIEVMRAAIDVGYEEFSEADIAFHEAVARASRNSLIQVCNDVVRGVVLVADLRQDLAGPQPAGADDGVARTTTPRCWRPSGRANGRDAARVARQKMYDYYAGYVPKAEREPLRALIDGD